MTKSYPCEQLQVLAVLAQRGATSSVNLAALWQELTNGTTRIVHSFFTKEDCFLVLTDREPNGSRMISAQRLRTLEAVLSGGDIKTAAFDLALTPSTVSQTATLALRQLGLECTAGRVPVLVSLAAVAARNGDLAQQGMSAMFSFEQRTYRSVWASRPEDRLACILTTAQHDVVRRLVEGHPHSEIARRRGTSARTVANQLGAVFRRLGVSGRGSLIQYVIAADRAHTESARGLASRV